MFCFSFRKSKILSNELQLLVDQRQNEIERLKKSLDEKNLIVARVEKTSQDEVKRIFSEKNKRNNSGF